MKSTIITLILIVFTQFCQAAKDTILPEEPWRAIVFIEKYNPVRWEDNISIKLFGSYSPSDSLMIENSLQILNGLSETVKLSITKKERGNLEIFFRDSINDKIFESIIAHKKTDESKYSILNNYYQTSKIWTAKSIRHCELSLRLGLIPENSRQNFLTNKLAFITYPGLLSSDYLFESGREIRKRPNSIFNQNTYEKIDGQWVEKKTSFYSELSEFDRLIIKTVYATNFPELLPIAKKQFDPVPSWLRKNSKKLMVFPFVLALFLFAGLIILFYKKLGIKIHNRFLRFNVVSFLALISIGIVVSLYIVTSSKLKDPYFSFYNVHDIRGGIFVLLMLGLPSLNVIRIIETVINRTTQHKYFTVLLLFVSTSLIPSVSLFSIGYFSNEHLNENSIEIFSIVFLIFIIIGIIRALISFFILKEKEIKIENEIQLANLRELKSKAELNALHSKINPHFLYNALNSIAGLAKTDAEKTEQMALSLSKLFRYSINKEQTDWSTFAEEMEMVRIYLDIEKVRFEDRLEFTIELPDELKLVKVPRFIIQPLVENAVKHGISKLVSKGEIKASVRKNDRWIEIIVVDNGPDFPEELSPGFGLQSIYDKLEIMYPNRFEMHFINASEKHILIKLA
jgi:sensor histidine kinase YesM